MTFDKWIPRHFSIIPQSGSQFCLTYHCVILRPSLILPNHILISHLIASVLHDAKRTPNHEIVHYDIDMLVETWSWAVAMCQQNPKAHWLGVSQTRLGCFVVSPLCRGKGHLAFHFWVLPFCFMVFPCNGKSIGKEERVAPQLSRRCLQQNSVCDTGDTNQKGSLFVLEGHGAVLLSYIERVATLLGVCNAQHCLLPSLTLFTSFNLFLASR